MRRNSRSITSLIFYDRNPKTSTGDFVSASANLVPRGSHHELDPESGERAPVEIAATPVIRARRLTYWRGLRHRAGDACAVPRGWRRLTARSASARFFFVAAPGTTPFSRVGATSIPIGWRLPGGVAPKGAAWLPRDHKLGTLERNTTRGANDIRAAPAATDVGPGKDSVDRRATSSHCIIHLVRSGRQQPRLGPVPRASASDTTASRSDRPP